MEHKRVITITDAGAAGLMGNPYAESGLRSNNLQNSYEGMIGYADAEYNSLVGRDLYTTFANDPVGYGLAQRIYLTRQAALLAHAKAPERVLAIWKCSLTRCQDSQADWGKLKSGVG